MASSSSSSAHVNNKAFAAAAATSATSSLPSLSDLISLQLDQLQLGELVYKDELQLLRLLAVPPAHRQKQAHKVEVGHGHGHGHGHAPLSKAESADDEVNGDGDELIGAIGGLSISPTTQPATEAKDAKEPPLLDFRTHVIKWFQRLREQSGPFKSDEESRRLREAGNDSYRKERHALKACDFFTEAIFRAPAKNSMAAALAHANRSTVLYDCGMYAQSYDDCLCALDLGYPDEYLPLVKLRQAACALNLRNYALCEQHLHELLHLELNDLFESRTHELWHQCELLKAERFEMAVQTGDDLGAQSTKSYEIAWLDKVASMRASRLVAKNTIVFEEEASAMVPSGNSRICDHCGVTQFIEFPCVYCSNRSAVYCSRQCRVKHAPIHALECFAHQIELFEAMGELFAMPRLIQLALRMLVTGLPQVLAHCRKRATLAKMWSALNGVLAERTDLAYSAILRLETHTDGAQDPQTLAALAVVAHLLAIYLSKCTAFFDQLERHMPAGSKLSRCEWELLTAALLLRHICQLRHKHLTHCLSFVLPADPHVLAPLNAFQLWAAPQRVRPGQLHLIAGDVAVVAYAVFPYTLSLCRHSCTSSISSRFSGRKLTAFARTDLLNGASIYSCFANGNYQQSTCQERQFELRGRGIDCQCEQCVRGHGDEEFNKFHRYRCDNPQCMQVFTPASLQQARNLRWWLSEHSRAGAELLVCSHCKEPQKLEWFWSFSSSLLDCELIEERCKLYGAVERADAHLLELHECKVALARRLLEQCLMVHREGAAALDDWELNKLGSIMRSALPSAAAQHGNQSLEYVKHCAYFWDIMALSNYKCSDRELMQMLNALDFIPDEYKEIFINYYEDYIAPKFADESYGSLIDTQV